jgi:hypothetical protein
MNVGQTVFAQLMDFVPAYQFRKCVARHRGEYKVQAFSCWNQYLCMAFAQLTCRESLRDIEACLRSAPIKLYHLGIRGGVARNTLAHANAVRDWRIYADFAQVLIGQARVLYAGEELAVRLGQTVYALDSTTIDLCLALFPWAKFRRHKAAIKMHTLFDVRASVPTLVIVTHGKVHDVRILDELVFEVGGLYVMDRGYLDFARLHCIQQAGAFFVTRAKKNFRCERLSSRPVDKTTVVPCDQTVRLSGFYSRQDYSDNLRRICYRDAATGKCLVFLTNNFALPADVIATVYRYRWHVELFFKWIKQHLRIKAFYGTSENAVKTQVWIAISVYVLVAIVKKRLKVEHRLYTILQILSVTIFQKTPISQVFSDVATESETPENHNQLILFK